MAIDDAQAGNESLEGIKRTRRACDNCRRSKIKCIIDALDKPCDACVLANIPCTFLDPIFKRGPPKGYIQAIEQRLRQVESILGFIIGAPDARAATLISDLRGDITAREIIRRVNAGPFGPSGRKAFDSSADVSQDAFLAAVAQSANMYEKGGVRGSRRSREAFSSDSDKGFIENPTFTWQDNLRSYLQPDASLDVDRSHSSTSCGSMSPMQEICEPHNVPSRVSPDLLQAPSIVLDTSQYEKDVYAEYEDEEVDDDRLGELAEAVGGLSMDEANQLRHHGEVSGMPLLESVSGRTDQLNEGGIWRLSMTRSKRLATMGLADILHTREEDIEVDMPTVEHQTLLIDLYFIYVHPVMPVIHKATFLKAFKRRASPRKFAERLLPLPEIPNLLLLTMFSVAARYNKHEQPIPLSPQIWEAGCDYLASARQLLNVTFHKSSLTTCQALILLAYREMGIGSMEQAWICTGMAVRMAQDLGLHREAEHWSRIGVSLFTPEENLQRKWVWWACVMVDKHISCSLGRPVCIAERDYDNALLERSYIDEPDGQDTWTPHPKAMPHKMYPSILAWTTSCFIAKAILSVIVGRIVEKIYSIHPKPAEKNRRHFSALQTDLLQWYADLPEHLHINPTSKPVPPPHILSLHLQFWWAVILLYRRFIPRRKRNTTDGALTASHNAAISPERAHAQCRAAATHICKIATIYRAAFSLNAASAFLPAYLMSAGIMHIATLSLKRDDEQAGTGLQQIIEAFKELSVTWPSALIDYDLLVGVEVKFETSGRARIGASGSRGRPETGESSTSKRDVEEGFGQEQQAGTSRKAQARGGSTSDSHLHLHRNVSLPALAHQEMNTRLLARALNIEIPNVEPLRLCPNSAPSNAGEYDWWPPLDQTSDDATTTWDTMPSSRPNAPFTELQLLQFSDSDGTAARASISSGWPGSSSSEKEWLSPDVTMASHIPTPSFSTSSSSSGGPGHDWLSPDVDMAPLMPTPSYSTQGLRLRGGSTSEEQAEVDQGGEGTSTLAAFEEQQRRQQEQFAVNEAAAAHDALLRSLFSSYIFDHSPQFDQL